MKHEITHKITEVGEFTDAYGLFVAALREDFSKKSEKAKDEFIDTFRKDMNTIATQAFHLGVEYQKEQQK